MYKRQVIDPPGLTVVDVDPLVAVTKVGDAFKLRVLLDPSVNVSTKVKLEISTLPVFLITIV